MVQTAVISGAEHLAAGCCTIHFWNTSNPRPSERGRTSDFNRWEDYLLLIKVKIIHFNSVHSGFSQRPTKFLPPLKRLHVGAGEAGGAEDEQMFPDVWGPAGNDHTRPATSLPLEENRPRLTSNPPLKTRYTFLYDYLPFLIYPGQNLVKLFYFILTPLDSSDLP